MINDTGSVSVCVCCKDTWARRLTRLKIGEKQCRPTRQSGRTKGACHFYAQCGKNVFVLLEVFVRWP
jgi:hypothetical protein